MDEPLEVFCCYAPEDEPHLIQLQKHLRSWEHRGLITLWAAMNIPPGTERKQEINKHLDAAHLILLLISPDFIDSDTCYTEAKRAMERHEQDEALVLPILLRPVEWRSTPFGKLQALPRDGMPVVGLSGRSRDDAFFGVAKERLDPEDYEKIENASGKSHHFNERTSSYYQSGMMALEQGKWDKAELCFKESLEKESHDRPELAAIYHNLGVVTMVQNKLKDAEKYFTQALQIRIEYGDKEQQAYCSTIIWRTCAD